MHRSPFPRLTDASLSVDGAAAAPAPKRPAVQMPDEYLPPNKILFLQNLPESVTKDQLMALFSQLAFYPHSPTTSVDCPSPDIQTCTKSGSFQQSGTSRSWSIWTRGAQGLPRMLCTTTSSTERTRSRHASHLVSFWSRTYPFHRSPLHASNRLLYDRCKLFCNKT